MQDQIYNILSSRSRKPLRQIIKDTKRTDFYLDAKRALEYGLIDGILAGQLSVPKPANVEMGNAGERLVAGQLNGDQPADAEALAARLAMRETREAGGAGGEGS